MANTYLVQYSVPGKDYSVGFSTREAAEKAVAKLTAHGRAAVIVEPKQTITREENIMENTNTVAIEQMYGPEWAGYPPAFAVGQSVVAVALPNGFPEPRPEITGLKVTDIRVVLVPAHDTGLQSYYRVTARGDGICSMVEGAERFFAVDPARS